MADGRANFAKSYFGGGSLCQTNGVGIPRLVESNDSTYRRSSNMNLQQPRPTGFEGNRGGPMIRADNYRTPEEIARDEAFQYASQTRRGQFEAVQRSQEHSANDGSDVVVIDDEDDLQSNVQNENKNERATQSFASCKNDSLLKESPENNDGVTSGHQVNPNNGANRNLEIGSTTETSMVTSKEPVGIPGGPRKNPWNGMGLPSNVGHVCGTGVHTCRNGAYPRNTRNGLNFRQNGPATRTGGSYSRGSGSRGRCNTRLAPHSRSSRNQQMDTFNRDESSARPIPRDVPNQRQYHVSGGEAARPSTNLSRTTKNTADNCMNLFHTVTSGALDKKWADAPEFIPKFNRPRSYAEATGSFGDVYRASTGIRFKDACIVATCCDAVTGTPAANGNTPATDSTTAGNATVTSDVTVVGNVAATANVAARGNAAIPNNENVSAQLCSMVERVRVCKRAPGSCPNLHGDVCDVCGEPLLHPTNFEKRNEHLKRCAEKQKRDVEIQQAVERSQDKTCGICFEVVLEKQPMNERRFGILNQCNHCFCLSCIRRWRQARHFEHNVVRGCPECRVTSDFVCPSVYWVETKEAKDKLISDYKSALSEKQCKYFRQGLGRCPFGNKCFYLHALPDGTKTDVGPPLRRRRPNHNVRSEDLELGDVLQQIFLWDFIDEHDHFLLYGFTDDIEELVAFLSDSDESEAWSDYEFLLD